MSVTGFMALSSLAIGFLGQYLSPPSLFLWAGIGGSLSALLGLVLLASSTASAPPPGDP